MIWKRFFKKQRHGILFFLLHLFMAVDTSVIGAHDVISFDVCYTGHQDVMFVDVTFERCVVECQMRQSCVSINYLTRMHLCRLHTTYSMKLECMSPGFVFSKKSDWQNNNVPTGCTLCGPYQTCVPGDGINNSVVCMFTECQPIERPTNGQLLGNLVHVGAKVLPKCNAGYAAYPPVVRICQASGVWNLPEPLCLQEIADMPIADNCNQGWILYDHSCYLATNMKKTYDDSVEFCTSQDPGAHLVTVESEAERTFVQNKMDTTLGASKKELDAFWLGIKERLEPRVWRYTHNGQLATWLQFRKGELNDPFDDIEVCAALWFKTTWQWIDWGCHEKGYIMCELQLCTCICNKSVCLMCELSNRIKYTSIVVFNIDNADY